jgi:hypothetical protein
MRGYIPHGVYPMNRSDALDPNRIYRFSEVVNAIGSTPKSLRRWMLTLEWTSETSGWTEFTPSQTLMLAIMRHLVDWGISVPQASTLATEMIAALIVGEDHHDITAEEFEERIEASHLTKLSLAELIMALSNKRAFLTPVQDSFSVEYENLKTKRKWFAGSFGKPAGKGEPSCLVLDFGAIGSAMHLRMTEPTLRDFGLRSKKPPAEAG